MEGEDGIDIRDVEFRLAHTKEALQVIGGVLRILLYSHWLLESYSYISLLSLGDG